MDSYARIEAGPDMCGPAPARRSAFPLWALRMIGALLIGLGMGIRNTRRSA